MLLALAFLAAAVAKLTGNEMMVANFARFGYPLWFMYFVGVAEIAGAIGLLLKPTAVWAAVCLGVLMLGAVGTHFINDPPPQAVPAIVLLDSLRRGGVPGSWHAHARHCLTLSSRKTNETFSTCPRCVVLPWCLRGRFGASLDRDVRQWQFGHVDRHRAGVPLAKSALHAGAGHRHGDERNGAREPDKAGVWSVELHSTAIMMRRGFTKDYFRPGDQVTVTGGRMRDGSKMIRLFNGTKADGTQFYGDDFRPQSTGHNLSPSN